jgi:hypothetical protein
MIANPMTLFGNAPGEGREALHVAAAKKERGSNVMVSQDVQNRRGLFAGPVVKGQRDRAGIARPVCQDGSEPLRFGRRHRVPHSYSANRQQPRGKKDYADHRKEGPNSP